MIPFYNILYTQLQFIRYPIAFLRYPIAFFKVSYCIFARYPIAFFKLSCHIYLRGYSLIGKTAILHIVILGSSPNISNVNVKFERIY
jgi:hypothetical protein